MVLQAGRPQVVEGLELVRLVGRGGEGEVWEARDAEGRRRALKLVAPECLAVPAEAAVRGAWLVRIDHPALVRVHRSGVLGWVADRGGVRPWHATTDDDELAGWGFVEMDFVDGQSLATAPADPDVLRRLHPLAEALDLLHAGYWSDGVPLVHRDVKPANLVSDERGRLVLVDFSTLRGVAAGDVTRIGTPVYSAPEAFDGGGLGPAADVYSFAATIVALVTGYRGRTLVDVLADPQRAGFPPCIARALAYAPDDRPTSCRALLTDLADFMSPRELRPAATWEAPVAAMARRRAVLPWVAVAAAVLAGPGAALYARASLERSELVTVGAVALVTHLVVHLAVGTSFALTLFVPPLAWAVLLGERAAQDDRRRAWARALLAPGCAGMAATAPLLLLGDTQLALASGPGGLLLTLLAVAAVRTGAGGGAFLRVLTLPLWLIGACLFLAVGLLALPFALLGGRGAGLLRFSGAPLAGVVEVGRPPG